MTQAERIAREEAEIAAFGEIYAPIYAAWLDAQPPVTPAFTWTVPVSNDNSVVTVAPAANDNLAEAA